LGLGQFEVVARQSHRLKRQIIGNTNREKNYDTLYKHSPYNHSPNRSVSDSRPRKRYISSVFFIWQGRAGRGDPWEL